MGDYFLTVNGLKLDRLGFCTATDLTDLIQAAPVRGFDFTAQGVAGDTFRPKVRGSLTALVGLELEGDVTSTGVAHPAPGWAGIRANAEEIEAACVAGTAAALQTVAVTYPDGLVRSAPGYCRRLDVALFENDKTGAFASAVLEVVIPSGVLT